MMVVLCGCVTWRARQDSNLRPTDSKPASALHATANRISCGNCHAALPRGHAGNAFLIAPDKPGVHGHRRVDAGGFLACVPERLLNNFRVVARHEQPHGEKMPQATSITGVGRRSSKQHSAVTNSRASIAKAKSSLRKTLPSAAALDRNPIILAEKFLTSRQR